MIRAREPILIDDYLDSLILVSKFGEEFLGVDRKISVVLLLRKVQKFMVKTKNSYIEPL